MRVATTEELKFFVCFLFWKRLGIFPTCTAPQTGINTPSHFWIPAHSVNCVPTGSLNPWEQENQCPPESINTQPWPGRPQPPKTGVLALGPDPTSNPRLPKHVRAPPSPPTGPHRGPALRGSAGGRARGAGTRQGGAAERSRRHPDRCTRPEGRPRRRGRGFEQTPPPRPPPEQVATGEGRGTPASEGGRPERRAYQTPRPSCRIF